jgi:CMP-2-keto-3-deoxyoctulosonic acid synthetase
MCSDFYEECRYCVVTYPDGTRAYIFDKPTLMKHIEFHKRHVAMNYQADPPFIYEKYYKEHFDEFRQEKIRREFLAKQTKKKELFID